MTRTYLPVVNMNGSNREALMEENDVLAEINEVKEGYSMSDSPPTIAKVRTIDGCPVCGSARGEWQGFGLDLWLCYNCGRLSRFPAQIPVPSSITQHIADTAAAEWQRWERLTTNPNAKEVIGCLCAGFDMECNCATAAAESAKESET